MELCNGNVPSTSIIGEGFLSFNDYAFNQGFRYYGERWNYQAHNVYLQLLGETGIIGFSLIAILIILIIIKAISIAKHNLNFGDVCLVYWIVLFGVYSLTGNNVILSLPNDYTGLSYFICFKYKKNRGCFL